MKLFVHNYVCKFNLLILIKKWGVAILIKKEINYIEIKKEYLSKIEAIAIEIHINESKYIFVTYYNPPNEIWKYNLFTSLVQEYKNIIICGDLNAKTTTLGSKANNKNGEILEEILINTNLIQLNNKQPTYHRTHDNSSDILDWILVSNNLYSQF